MKAVILLLAFLSCPILSLLGRETIVVNGQTIRNCKIVEISHEGPIYLCEDTSQHHILPWSQLPPQQQAYVRENHNEALVNAICEARYVNGTVFHANKDGVVIQVSLEDKGEVGIEGYQNGAKVMHSGLVLISDLPLHIPRSAGDPINVIAYFKVKAKFDMVIAATEMEHLTIAKPEWFQLTKWTNSQGNTMEAKLVGIKGDKVLFERKDAARFVYSLNQLDSASQEKAKKIHARLSRFPVP